MRRLQRLFRSLGVSRFGRIRLGRGLLSRAFGLLELDELGVLAEELDVDSGWLRLEGPKPAWRDPKTASLG